MRRLWNRSSYLALLLAAVLCFAARAQACVPSATVDWMVSSDALAAPIRPAECASVEQNPPDFGWPDVSAEGTYQVSLSYPDGRMKTLAAAQNWINWDEVLPAGTYLWQVELTDSSGTRVSRAREFTVSARASSFLVPDAAALLNRVTTTSHPRGLPDPTSLALMLVDRQSAVSALQIAVNSRLSSALPGAPPSSVESEVGNESQRTLDSLMAYIFTNQDVYFNDALRRVLNLASWDPRGSTSYAATARASRQIAWTLALGYDWLHLRLDSAQRNLVLSALQARGADMYNDIIGPRSRIAKSPRDSEGNRTLTVLAVISTLLAGDLIEANTWLQGALPLAINATNPWGSEEGGVANADAFGTWDVGELLVPWYILRWSAGVDLAQKAWVRNWSRFIAYLLPPGTPSGVFGDGAEQALSEAWARFGKGYTHFAPTALGRWYASQLGGEDQTRMEYLLSPLAEPASNTFPAGTPNSAVFQSLGQAAMHSDLADPARTSIYFKSSPAPYGSFDHSHADQNSFVVNAGGQRLAIDSGYYDGYKTQHWWQWYKQTRAHNAITFDGGKGQLFFEQDGKMGYGAITNHGLHSERDIVHGDATRAYGGALQEAKRSVVYLRPNLVLVYDRLASDIPRQWEWNIHALNQISVASDRNILIENNGQLLCVDMLAGPTMRFNQTNVFTAAPGATMPEQWHGNFSSVERLSATEFIALLNVGCTATTASASKVGGHWTVLVGAKTVTISDIGIGVAAATFYSGAGLDAAGNDITAPSTPTSLIVSALTQTSLSLNWSAATDNVGVSGYRVYRDGMLVASAAGTSASLSGLSPSTLYSFTVAALDAAGNASAQSAPLPVTTPDTTAPSAPSGLAASAVTSTSLTLTWSAATDNVAVSGYRVYRDGVQVASAAGTSASLSGLAPSTLYSFTVAALDAAGNASAQSAPLPVTTPVDTTAPSTPGGLTASAVTSTSLTLTWSAATDNVGVRGYRVYRDGVQVADVTVTRYSDAGLSPARTYSYTVSAYDTAANESAKSAVVSVNTPASTPFSGTPIAIPATFEAESFDRGGEGVAYHDNVKGNAGGQYRLSEDVDIIAASGGYVVNSFETAEWLAYTINVAASARYDIEIRAASAFSNSAFHVEIDGVNVTGTVTVPNTGSWNTFQWIGRVGVPLSAGQHLLKIVSDQQYFDLDSIRVIATPTVATPYSGTPIALPGSFEAENFDLGGEGLAYHDNVKGNVGGQYRVNEDVDIVLSPDASGGGYVVNNFETGEWLAYTINVAATGPYDIEIRAASGFSNSAFHIEIDGVNVTGTVTVPNTGSSWNIYQWVGKKGVTLAAGNHVLKIVADQQYFNLNSIRVTVVDTQAPSVPANLTTTLVSPLQVGLSWSAATDNVGVTGYFVYRDGMQVAKVSGTSYADPAVASATTYSYTVAAYDAAGNVSARTSAVSATIPLGPTAYSGTPIIVPGTFEAENFDRGGEGVAYHDNVTGNAGAQHRPLEDVDIIVSSDALGGGHVVNNFETGEWLAYTINVAASALYDIEIRAASGFSTSAFHVEIDGVDVTGTVLVPNTGWSNFQWVGKKTVALTAGKHVLKIVSDQQYFDLNSIRVLLPGVAAPTAGTPLWSAGMEGGNMAEWYLNGGGLESNGHSSFSTVGEDGSITLATQEQAHSGTWSAKLSIPTSGAARLVRQAEPVQNPELYYTVWYYFPRNYTIPSSPGFWMLQQWKSRVPAEGKHDPFFMLQAYNPAPGSMKFKLCWFPLPIEGPLPGQRGYREWLSNIEIPVGRWIKVETRYKSAGDFTGAIQMWIDGVEVWHMENVRTRYSNGDTIWSATSYGQGLSPSPIVIYVDDVVISRAH